MKKFDRFLIFIAKLIIGVGFIFAMIHKGAFNVALLFKAVLTSPLLFLAGGSVVFLMIFLGNLRWFLVMRMTGNKLSYLNTFLIGLIGVFFATFTPGGITSDIMRSYYSSQQERFSMPSLAAIIIDRGGALVGQILTSVFCGILIYNRIINSFLKYPFFFVVILFAVVGLVIFLFYCEWLPKWFYRIKKANLFLMIIKNSPNAFFLSIGISVLNSVLLGVGLLIFFLTMEGSPSVDFTYFFFAGPFIAISLTLPITPAGIGVGQIAGILFFNNISNQAISCGAEVISLVQLAWLIVGLVGAVVFILYRKQGSINGIKASRTDPLSCESNRK
nr:lysylphosphatidylglycerol synthase transmembrane domain-containing protein [uncultured Desulfobacter sp.]